MWFVFHANTPEHQTLFQSGWFVVGLLSQTLIAYDPYPPHSVHQSRAAWPQIVMTGIVMALGIALPFSPLAGYLQLQALPLSCYFPWLVAILAGYMVLTQMVKGFYARQYGWQ